MRICIFFYIKISLTFIIIYYYLSRKDEEFLDVIIEGNKKFELNTSMVTHVCIDNCSRFLTKSAFMTLESNLLGLSTVRAVSVNPGHRVITVTPVFS